MKKLVLYKKCLLAFMVILFFSCKNEMIEEISPKPAELNATLVTVENGMLKFESKESFQNFMSVLVVDHKVVQNLNQVAGFESMKSLVKRLGTKELDSLANSKSLGDYEDIFWVKASEAGKQIIPIVEDEFLASVINGKGLVRIGNEIVKIGRDQVYFVPSNVSKNELAIFESNPESLANTKSFEIKKIAFDTTGDSLRVNSWKPFDSNTGYGGSDFDCCTRLYNRIFYVNYIVYTSRGVYTSIQKHHWLWGWNTWGSPNDTKLYVGADVFIKGTSNVRLDDYNLTNLGLHQNFDRPIPYLSSTPNVWYNAQNVPILKVLDVNHYIGISHVQQLGINSACEQINFPDGPLIGVSWGWSNTPGFGASIKSLFTGANVSRANLWGSWDDHPNVNFTNALGFFDENVVGVRSKHVGSWAGSYRSDELQVGETFNY